MKTAAGTLALGVALLACGVAFGSPSLLVPGFALTAIAVLAMAWTRAAAFGAELIREPGPARVVEGDSYPLTLELRRGLVPPLAGEIRDALLERPIATGPLQLKRIDERIAMPRRGRHRLEGTSWVIRDPLGLVSRTVQAPAAGDLLVLPRIEQVNVGGRASMDGEGTGAASAGEEGAAAIREARAVEFEVDGIRPYREGSPASRIHWPTVARSGEMHERRILAGSEATPLVALDAEHPADEDALDRAVRAAASLAVFVARGSGCAVLLPGGRAPVILDRRLRAWPAIHSSFATVIGGAPTRLPRRAAGAAGSVFWVTAAPPGQASGVPRSAGPGRHYVVSAFRPEGATDFEVAGCFGVATGAGRSDLARVAA